MKQKLFDTIDGKTFYFNRETDTFLVAKGDSRASTLVYYVGCIDPRDNSDFRPDIQFIGADAAPGRRLFSLPRAELAVDEYVMERLNHYGQAWLSNIPGFSREFREGHYPVGVQLRHRANLSMEAGRLTLDAVTTRMYVEDQIVRVYNRITDKALPVTAHPANTYRGRQSFVAA